MYKYKGTINFLSGRVSNEDMHAYHKNPQIKGNRIPLAGEDGLNNLPKQTGHPLIKRMYLMSEHETEGQLFVAPVT